MRPAAGSTFEYLLPGVQHWPGGQTAVRLAASGHEDATIDAYTRHAPLAPLLRVVRAELDAARISLRSQPFPPSESVVGRGGPERHTTCDCVYRPGR